MEYVGRSNLGCFIYKHGGFCNERIPIVLANAITGLATMYHCKLKWSVNVGVAVVEINPTADGDEIVARCLFLQCIEKCDKVGIYCAKHWSGILARNACPAKQTGKGT